MPEKNQADIGRTMRTLARAIDGLELPAVEKIARRGAEWREGSPGSNEDPFEVLVATMLSAQTRDPITAAATARLFRVGRTPAAIARLPVARIQRLIYPVSFYRHKARHLQSTCRALVSKHGGKVPTTMEELLALPGVGRKTANLVLILGHASRDNICVDTHVHRLANRLGWVRTKTPKDTELALYRVAHRRWWPLINLYLVTWGQNVCRPVYPRCGCCSLSTACPRIGVTRVGRSS